MVRKITFRNNLSAVANNNLSTIINIDKATELNNSFREVLWEGKHLLVTVMTIPVSGETGFEIHENQDQFIKIESGKARVVFGNDENSLNYERSIDDDYAVLIAANTRHNIYNSGNEPLRLFSIYAPTNNITEFTS